ncbi:MAG: hypothetical protein ACHQ51_09450 [Elusimicrobiota bacterium]
MNKIRRAAGAAALALAAAGCSGVVSRVHQGQIGEVIDQTPERRGYFEAIGIGASDPATPTATQRKALSRDAAIVKAQYELLSQIKGVTLDGGVTVSQAMEKDSTLTARVHDMLRGAEVRKTEFTADGGCVVTLRLPKARLLNEAQRGSL